MATTLQVSKAVLHGNAGLLRFSQQDYAGALEEFEAATAADPADSAAVNNAAICQLLNTQVGAATSSGPPVDRYSFRTGRDHHAKPAAPPGSLQSAVVVLQHFLRLSLEHDCAGAQRCARAADGCAGAANAAADAGLRVHAGPTVRAG